MILKLALSSSLLKEDNEKKKTVSFPVHSYVVCIINLISAGRILINILTADISHSGGRYIRHVIPGLIMARAPVHAVNLELTESGFVTWLASQETVRPGALNAPSCCVRYTLCGAAIIRVYYKRKKNNPLKLKFIILFFFSLYFVAGNNK